MSERRQQARDEAERRWRKGDDRAPEFSHTVGCIKGFMQGVDWADDLHQPRPTTATVQDTLGET